MIVGLNERMRILKDLVFFSKPLNQLVENIAKLDWDYEGTPYVIKTKQVLSVLDRYLSGELNEHDIENWANLIECREDIEFEKQKELEKLFYKLSNPEIEEKITITLCNELRKILL